MSLTLYYHPLASYCWKVLIALYENDIAFTPHSVDLGDEQQRTQFTAIWPIGKFPVLHDAALNCTLPETSIIIEYLAQYYPGRVAWLPRDPILALQVRLQDRFYDLYISEPMSKIVTDKLRPTGQHDSFGVERAKELLATSYAIAERELAGKTWAAGDSFTLADCSAAPALFYANKVAPFEATHPNLAGYLNRLMTRPSFARVLTEAQPYFAMFPG